MSFDPTHVRPWETPRAKRLRGDWINQSEIVHRMQNRLGDLDLVTPGEVEALCQAQIYRDFLGDLWERGMVEIMGAPSTSFAPDVKESRMVYRDDDSEET